MLEQKEFTKDTIILIEENDFVEFKGIASERPVNKIVNYVEKYVLGFLNAQLAGDLYCGIEDNGTVTGVLISRKDRDNLYKNIYDKLSRIDPAIPKKCYEMCLHKVVDLNSNLVQDLYVVQININQIYTGHFPYRTTSGSVYFKELASCPKMTSEEISNEARRRFLANLKKEADSLDTKLLNNPYSISLLKKRADVAKYMSDIETLDKVYKKILEIEPTNSKTRIEYATAHKSIGDLKGALEIIDEALKSNIEDFSILQNKGSILSNLERWDEASEYYKKALTINPDDYTLITKVGVALREQGKYIESLDFLNYALSKCPSYRLAKYEKKKTYYQIYKK